MNDDTLLSNESTFLKFLDDQSNFFLSYLTLLTIKKFDIEGNNFHGKTPSLFQTFFFSNVGFSGTLPSSSLCSSEIGVK
jgi:hypothetical protein